MKQTLTKTEQAVFDFIRMYKENNGKTPSLSQIQQNFGWNRKSPGRSYNIVRILEKKGYVKLPKYVPQDRIIEIL